MTDQPKPFGYEYQERARRCPANATPCARCGKPCRDPWRFAVTVVDGGAAYGTRESPEDPGHMGCFPVGPDCARVLRRAGVEVLDWAAELREGAT